MKIHGGHSHARAAYMVTCSFHFPTGCLSKASPVTLFPPNGGEIPILWALRIPLSGSEMDTVPCDRHLHVEFTAA